MREATTHFYLFDESPFYVTMECIELKGTLIRSLKVH